MLRAIDQFLEKNFPLVLLAFSFVIAVIQTFYPLLGTSLLCGLLGCFALSTVYYSRHILRKKDTLPTAVLLLFWVMTLIGSASVASYLMK